MFSPAQLTLTNILLNLTSEETATVFVSTMYHSMPSSVCRILEEPQAALPVYSTARITVAGSYLAPCAGPTAQKLFPCPHILLFANKEAAVS